MTKSQVRILPYPLYFYLFTMIDKAYLKKLEDRKAKFEKYLKKRKLEKEYEIIEQDTSSYKSLWLVKKFKKSVKITEATYHGEVRYYDNPLCQVKRVGIRLDINAPSFGVQITKGIHPNVRKEKLPGISLSRACGGTLSDKTFNNSNVKQTISILDDAAGMFLRGHLASCFHGEMRDIPYQTTQPVNDILWKKKRV